MLIRFYHKREEIEKKFLKKNFCLLLAQDLNGDQGEKDFLELSVYQVGQNTKWN